MSSLAHNLKKGDHTRIAEALGCSASLVKKVLNDRPNAKSPLSVRIRQATQQLLDQRSALGRMEQSSNEPDRIPQNNTRLEQIEAQVKELRQYLNRQTKAREVKRNIELRLLREENTALRQQVTALNQRIEAIRNATNLGA